MGELYKGTIMGKWGRTSLLMGSHPEWCKLAISPRKIAHPYPLAPPIPWDLTAFPFLFLIFIIHSHFQG